jgi:uncharacterized protein YkwD
MTTATPDNHPATGRRQRPLKAFATLLALAVTLVTPGLVFAWDADSFSSSDEALLLQLTNEARAAAGLPALKLDGELVSMARWRSKDMIDNNYFSHSIPPDGKKVFDYLRADGYCFTVAGENIGTNNFSDDIATQTIEQGFMDSAGHRANILGTGWDAIGIGAYKGADGNHVWTVLFANKCSAAPAPTPAPTPKPAPNPTPKPTPRPAPKPTAAPVVIAPTAAPTAAPTPEPTPVPTPTPFLEDPTHEPTVLPTADVTAAPSDPAVTSGAGTDGLQVLDDPSSNDLVETIVGSVAGAYFGN